jgi:hypothetical protein
MNWIAFLNAFHTKDHLGQMPSVLFHELGHSINNYLYQDMGSPNGMTNGALHEGTADVHSAIMLGYPDVFRGEYSNDSIAPHARFLKNDMKLDIEITNEGHYDGQIIAGAFWDLSELTSLDLMAELFHYARFGTPDGESNAKAFTQFLKEVLITDDNDGDWSNLTPHFEEIVTAFDNHNITLDYYMQFNYLHTPLANTRDIVNPYSVELSIPFINNIKAVDNVWLHYANDKGYSDSILMNRNGDIYSSAIPAQSNHTQVIYYFTIISPFSNKYFALAPYNEKHFFFVGYDTLLIDNSTTDKEYAGSSQNSVKWQRIKLDTLDREIYWSSYIPLIDHSGDGYLWGISDVDKQFPRLRSADLIINLNASSEPNALHKCFIDLYFTFITNFYAQNDNEQAIIFSISNDDGATWKEVYKKINYQKDYSNDWQRLSFWVNDYFETFNNIKLKITAKGRTTVSSAANTAICVDDILVLIDDKVEKIEYDDINPIIYPNPSKNIVQINFVLEKYSENVTITINNILGQVMLMPIESQTYYAGIHTEIINVDNLLTGYYYMVIDDGFKRFIKPFMVVK